MRTREEILEMINKTNMLVNLTQEKVAELKMRNVSNLVDKKDLFLKECLPLFVITNLLTDRTAILTWALGNKEVEVTTELSRLSAKTFRLIRENLELFSMFI